jgi:hypothetical protein
MQAVIRRPKTEAPTQRAHLKHAARAERASLEVVSGFPMTTVLMVAQ